MLWSGTVGGFGSFPRAGGVVIELFLEAYPEVRCERGGFGGKAYALMLTLIHEILCEDMRRAGLDPDRVMFYDDGKVTYLSTYF